MYVQFFERTFFFKNSLIDNGNLQVNIFISNHFSNKLEVFDELIDFN